MPEPDGARGVILDMDGVLCDSEPFILEAAIRMFREVHGVELDPAAFEPFVGAGEDRYLGGPARERGIAIELPRDKERTYDIYLDLIRGRLRPLPGARAFIGRARAAGLRLAVASAADRRKVDGNLAEIGVPAEGFDALVTGSDVERKKPHPDGFLLAARRLGCPPERCVVVEDAVNGVRAARAAGCRCLGLTTTFPAEDLRAAGADAVAADLGEVDGAACRLVGLPGGCAAIA